jgi:hypothetical protein
MVGSAYGIVMGKQAIQYARGHGQDVKSQKPMLIALSRRVRQQAP